MNNTSFSTYNDDALGSKTKNHDFPSNLNQIISNNEIKQFPQYGGLSIEILFQRALHAHRTGDIKFAKDIYGYILSIQAEHVETLHALGVLATELQQWNTAIAWIQKALSIQPHSARFHHHLANIFTNIGRFESALAHYQAALHWNPQYAEAHNNLANLFYKQNKLSEAHQYYMHAIGLNPNYLEAHFNLGLVFLAQKEKNA